MSCVLIKPHSFLIIQDIHTSFAFLFECLNIIPHFLSADCAFWNHTVRREIASPPYLPSQLCQSSQAPFHVDCAHFLGLPCASERITSQNRLVSLWIPTWTQQSLNSSIYCLIIALLFQLSCYFHFLWCQTKFISETTPSSFNIRWISESSSTCNLRI